VTDPDGKVKLSRLSRHRQGKARRMKRLLFVLGLLVLAVFAVGAAFDFPYLNVARRGGSWLAKKISGGSIGGEDKADYLFLTNPQNLQALGGEVSALFAIYKAEEGATSKRTIIYLAFLTYNAEQGDGEFYLLPETTVTYNALGQPVPLKQALDEEKGLDLLRSTVNNMTASDVDYLVLLEFGEAMRLVQNLDLPPVELEEDLALPNPVNGDLNHLSKGQEIRDSDRLLSYLLASDMTDNKDLRDARLKRAAYYLPPAFGALGGEGQARLEEELASLDRNGFLLPSTGSLEGDRAYLASLIRAIGELPEGKLVVKAVPKVEVVNGCGLPDLGKKVGEKLLSFGVVVSGSAGNAKINVNGEEVNDFSHQTSSLIYRSEDRRVLAYARYLGVLMSIGDVSRASAPGPEILLIAGKDMAK